ncbi:GNAT family N-acetyltransferase [Streptomyces sp. TS71-3]|uniref:GNAT family N-acetyltransferase n=1 Tax=Streptomyces sp. TS71-3 TaxID=2733862 RepID=UPI001B092C14|nr:GNAT family N-acetyltransferase [Streptomyces sp. TS71-3]GHJ41533.1 GNAT family N-acetyltransferase [Streptomyces sp. TS71-3]
MSNENGLDIAYVSPSRAGDLDLMSSVTGLINEVYEVAEEGLWVEGTTRTTTQEVEALTRSAEIVTAHMDGEVVGCVRVQQLDGPVCEFGMLAAAPKRRGIGIGRELVRFAEEDSRQKGCGVMQLELLVPREWSHPSKVFLDEWYTRIGYRVSRIGSIEDFYPALAPHLATACDFIVYQKNLRE